MGGETLDGRRRHADDVYNRVDVYNPVTNTWRAGPPMPTARHGIFPVLDGTRIHVAGGGVRAGFSSSTVNEVLELEQTDNVAFSKSSLAGETSSQPTSLQFGPDGRLYVAQQNGVIKVYGSRGTARTATPSPPPRRSRRSSRSRTTTTTAR